MSKISKLKSKKLLIFVGLFAVAGIIVLLAAKAATPNVSLESESGSLSGNAQVATDSLASGGHYIKFGNTVTPPPPPTSCNGPTVSVTGTTTQKYTNANPAASTTFNLAGWYSNFVTGQGSSQAFDIGTGNAPKGVCINGGVVNGHIALNLGWQTVHDSIGGFGYRTATTGLEDIEDVRVHNVEDGWKPRECATTSDNCATFSNAGSMHMNGAYMTGIRDDAIEDDDFMPGDIQDSLFDGVWCFLSEQHQSGSGPTVGANEDPYIRITNVLVRLYETNGGETGAGHWFKFQPRGATNHTPIVTNSVFAVDALPRGGWSNLDIPPGTQWKGTNYILWLGSGTYGGPKPAGVTYMEGPTALAKWNDMRNAWLSSHGYATKTLNDLNSMDDPVVPHT